MDAKALYGEVAVDKGMELTYQAIWGSEAYPRFFDISVVDAGGEKTGQLLPKRRLRINVPQQPPRSAKARKKWIAIFEAARTKGLEEAYRDWMAAESKSFAGKMEQAMRAGRAMAESFARMAEEEQKRQEGFYYPQIRQF